MKVVKAFICKKCMNYGGRQPCYMSCEEDLIPTHCPHDDSSFPNSEWKEVHLDNADELVAVLNSILDDATGDIKNPNKRLWPIRAENYREAKKLLGW